jgi:hypothetical protein
LVAAVVIEWPAPDPLQPVPLNVRPPVLVVDDLAVLTDPALESPGAAKVTVEATAQLMALPAWGPAAEAIPPLTATAPTGMAMAAATTSNLRNM